MFRGNSHDESDNNGNTGIGITYGNSPVEVERGEPATKINDELVVYGNLSTDKFQDLLGKEAKNKKFSQYKVIKETFNEKAFDLDTKKYQKYIKEYNE